MSKDLYANKFTGEKNIPEEKVPTTIGNTQFVISNPPPLFYICGWRKQIDIELAPVGFRVADYAVEDMDGKNCRLRIAAAVNIADEKAQSEIAALTYAETIAQAKVDADVKAGDPANWSKETRTVIALLREIGKVEMDDKTWNDLLKATWGKLAK